MQGIIILQYIYKFCKREIYHCHYAISDYHSNELSSVNTLQERKLCIRSRMIEQSFVSAYRVYCVNIDILMWTREVLYCINETVWLTMCAYYSWEIALNVGLDVPFNDMEGWNGIWQKAVEVNSTKVYTTNEGASRVTLVSRHFHFI
jgi:hypothetical protein